MEMIRVVIHLSRARFCSSTLNFGEVTFYVLRQLKGMTFLGLNEFSFKSFFHQWAVTVPQICPDRLCENLTYNSSEEKI